MEQNKQVDWDKFIHDLLNDLAMNVGAVDLTKEDQLKQVTDILIEQGYSDHAVGEYIREIKRLMSDK